MDLGILKTGRRKKEKRKKRYKGHFFFFLELGISEQEQKLTFLHVVIMQVKVLGTYVSIMVCVVYFQIF